MSVIGGFRSLPLFVYALGVTLSIGNDGFFPRLSVSANRKVYAFFVSFPLASWAAVSKNKRQDETDSAIWT